MTLADGGGEEALNVDDWQVPLDRIEHDVVHSSKTFKQEWVAELRAWRADPKNANATTKDLFNKVAKMLDERGLGKLLTRLGPKPKK